MVAERRSWTVVAALLVVAIVSGVVLGACGTTAPAATSSASAVKRAAVLDSSEGGFSMEYPAYFVKVEPRTSASADPGLVYQAYLADPTGAKSGDKALDVIGVAVRSMNKAAGPDDLKKHKRQFAAMAAQLTGRPEGFKMVVPFTLTKLGGRPALRGAYVYKVGSVDVASVAYLMPVGDRVYWVTGQASKDTWDSSSRTIGAAISTFSLKG
jgi:hypothetical protein